MQRYNPQDKAKKRFSGKQGNIDSAKVNPVSRFWDNAARSEHSNVRNKNKGKKR